MNVVEHIRIKVNCFKWRQWPRVQQTVLRSQEAAVSSATALLAGCAKVSHSQLYSHIQGARRAPGMQFGTVICFRTDRLRDAAEVCIT